jgi:hypothetical protein
VTGREENARQAREEAEWRSIVENFGERAEIPEIEPLPAATYEAEPEVDAYEGPAELAPSLLSDEDRFIPAPPPPVPRAHGLRLAAWLGLFGVPLLGLVGVVLGISLPSTLGLFLVAWFVGGFGYLVATMGNGKGPDSGWDDGAVL